MTTNGKETMKYIFLQIKCTQEQKEQIRKLAKSEGRTMSSFVRYSLLKEDLKKNIDVDIRKKAC